MQFHVIGDSHAVYWNHTGSKEHKFHVCSVHGATASGLMNKESVTQAHNKFLNHIQKGNNIIIMLGEVECGYGCGYRNDQGMSLDETIVHTQKPYAEFLTTFCSDFESVICVGPILPSVDDPHVPNHKSKGRRNIKLNIHERTQLTRNWNKSLAAIAADLGHKYIDINHHLEDPETGLMNFSKWCTSPNDNHIKKNSGALYLQELLKVIG